MDKKLDERLERSFEKVKQDIAGVKSAIKTVAISLGTAIVVVLIVAISY